ncbi:hypothetical protein MRX96_005209 [Rhipicephalus microplus]
MRQCGRTTPESFKPPTRRQTARAGHPLGARDAANTKISIFAVCSSLPLLLRKPPFDLSQCMPGRSEVVADVRQQRPGRHMEMRTRPRSYRSCALSTRTCVNGRLLTGRPPQRGATGLRQQYALKRAAPQQPIAVFLSFRSKTQ